MEQVVRAYEAYKRKDDDLERHIYLRALQDTNEVLFYRLLLDHIEEMTPIVYTPMVALACQQFSHIYRRPRGLFISYPLRDSIPSAFANRPNREVDVIVVTDGERILGHRRPGCRRPRDPNRQTFFVHADRWNSSGADAAHHAGCGNQQRGTAQRSRVPRLAP